MQRRTAFRRAVATLAGIVACGAVATPSWATFPGRNGLVAYSLGNGDETPFRVAVTRPDGSEHRILLKASRRYSSGPAVPKWSADGRKLLFARYRVRDSFMVRELFAATSSGRQLTRIPLGLGPVFMAPGSYDWAPGGRRIVFSAGERLYTIGTDGTRRRALGEGSWPAWSSDGRYIAFERHTIGPAPWYAHLSRVFVMHPDGTGVRQLTQSGFDGTPSFSPDGRRVLYVRDDQKSVEWRDVGVSGRGDRLVLAPPPYQGGRFCSPPQWSPDGKRLAAIRVQEGRPNDVPGASFVSTSPEGDDERTGFQFPFAFMNTYSPCRFSWQAR